MLSLLAIYRVLVVGDDHLDLDLQKQVTPFLSKLVSRMEAVKSFFTGKDPLITKETAATAIARVHFDNTKLLKYLPSFQYESLQQTISNTCNLLQQKLNRD